MSEELLTTAQAAEVLGVHPGHVRRLVLAGRLVATKHGRDLVFRRADLAHVVRPPRGRPKRS